MFHVKPAAETGSFASFPHPKGKAKKKAPDPVHPPGACVLDPSARSLVPARALSGFGQA
jgi:hypothetical protein